VKNFLAPLTHLAWALLRQALAGAIPEAFTGQCVLVTDAVSRPAVSALLTRADLTALRYPIVESLYSKRSGGSSGVQLHAVYVIAPEHRARNLEDALPKVDRVASEAWLLKDMRAYSAPEQYEEAVKLAVKAEVLPPTAERCVWCGLGLGCGPRLCVRPAGVAGGPGFPPHTHHAPHAPVLRTFPPVHAPPCLVSAHECPMCPTRALSYAPL
jgi:hypothetical protein